MTRYLASRLWWERLQRSRRLKRSGIVFVQPTFLLSRRRPRRSYMTQPIVETVPKRRSPVFKLAASFSKDSSNSPLITPTSSVSTDSEKYSEKRQAEEYQTASEEYSKSTKKYRKIKERYNNIRKRYDKFTRQYKKATEEHKNPDGRKKIKEEYNKVNKAYKKVNEQYAKTIQEHDWSKK
ncbi:MAG: hypothetical protein M1820_000723 [Bogoriella megaspora]|nr:MAG: hypothetical protein M1820_000723 [Bogoriella megaspora]